MLRLALFVCFATAKAYIWPSPQLDALELFRWEPDKSGLLGLIQPCDFFLFGGSSSGRSDAADWIRTAYHDMATHNVTDGTGGMDASIRFAQEQARPEDVGDGFQNTLSSLINHSNRYVSMADVLTVGAIVAIENCGGPEIAFRGGRIDAVAPNKPGVPEPQQDLDSHISAFARQGFTQTEMIGLVACGHTFGGVQHAAFPDSVPVLNDPNNTQSVSHFDSTFVTFDNNVATEYISGTTQNPLVVGLNDTTNSDKRIFSSDGNATMRSFAKSPDHFSSTCADLFARMFNTVPRGVKLTEVITPLPIKPDNLKFDLAVDGKTIDFTGQVRFWDTPENTTQTVRMLWDDRANGRNNATLILSGVSPSGVRHTVGWYDTPLLTLNAAAGITNMRFLVDGRLENQGGVGFAIQDDLIWSRSSCVYTNTSITSGRFEIAVRNTLTPTRVFLEQASRDNISRPITLEFGLAPVHVSPPAAKSVYNLWSAVVNNTFAAFTIGAEIDGVKVTRNDPRSVEGFASCTGL
ncbi:heme peroxidase [Mycena alexandri]|uniref:Peroxidase n=1 Tax=Mycena alexandri TaxID=1745969 RepID=A0AAD6SRJ4_9AGAR|nr:heme peroxidase [Mycena alexandri]